MSATLARQGGRVQLEQSDMHLALNMTTMATDVFSHTATEERQQVIKKLRAEVREEVMQGVVFPGHNKVKAAIQWHPAIVRENQTDGCLPCQNGKAKNLQRRRRCKGTCAPPPRPVPPQPRTPLAPPADSERTPSSESGGVPLTYVYIHTALPSAWFSIMIYMTSMACARKIFFQICWLMQVHPQFSTLSAVW